MCYANVFKNLDQRTIEATKELIKKGFWKKDFSVDQKTELCIEWLKTVSEVYEVEVPKFVFSSSEINYSRTGGGCYNPIDVRINLFMKFSLVTFLHEFRHHLQSVKNIQMFKNNLEEDARAWSCSLFKIVAPESYRKAIENGTIYFS